MVVQAQTVLILEGSSTNRPLGFDGKDYYYQKDKMKLFLESQDVDLLDTIEIGPYKPMEKTQAWVEIEKPKEEWTSEDKARVLLNSRTRFILTCALSISKYEKVTKCLTIKDIWNTEDNTWGNRLGKRLQG